MPLHTYRPHSIALAVCFLFISAILTGCNPTEVQNSSIRSGGANGVDTNLLGKAFVYEDDPIALTGNTRLPASVNMGKLVSGVAQQITPANKSTLTNDCSFVPTKYSTDFSYTDPSSLQFSDCLKVMKSDDPTLTPLQPVSGSWVFTANTSDFYQVNAMYHTNKLTQKMLGILGFIHQQSHVQNIEKSVPPSVPYLLGDMGTWWYKYASNTSLMTKSAQLSVQSEANVANNASYDPVKNQVLLGYLTNSTQSTVANGALTVQDPSVIYHELGHSFMTIFLNMRNAEFVSGAWKPLPYQAFPYYGTYDELSSIGEGVADYFAYAMNGRTTFGQWAFGRFLSLSRPVTEENPLHAPGISSAVDERLSYPDLIFYYPQDPTQTIEDVHNTGMVISHYLVALTETLKTECFMDQEMATKHVMLLLADSFAFLGDLTGRGTDYNNTNDGTGKIKPLVNLGRTGAYEWYYGTRRVTMRRFAQTFAKNILHTMSQNFCPNLIREKSEQLLDMYGLLLFRHYDDNGTFSTSYSAKALREDGHVMTSTTGLKNSQVNFIAESQFNAYNFIADGSFPNTTPPTFVDEANRTKSVLVPKASLGFDTSGVNASLILDDSQSYGTNIAATTLFEGRVISPTVGIAGPEYNNKNQRISPGEIVGLVLNLTNTSSTPIGGVTILATPWAHMKVQPDPVTGLPSWRSKPCTINNFPSLSEGGLSSTDCADDLVLPKDGRRFRKPASASNWPDKALHPVCLARISSDNETRWVSQDEYRRTVLLLQDKDCLGYGTPDFSPSECLMRFLPGKDSAFLSRVDPQKSYYTTVNPSGASNFSLANSTGLALEVNKWIPPGTAFTCRLRMQFSNCADCFQSATDEDDYTDIEYGGHKPFRVLDVPITIFD